MCHLEGSDGGRRQLDRQLGSAGSLVLGQGLLVDRELDRISGRASPQVVHPRLQASLAMQGLPQGGRRCWSEHHERKCKD